MATTIPAQFFIEINDDRHVIATHFSPIGRPRDLHADAIEITSDKYKKITLAISKKIYDVYYGSTGNITLLENLEKVRNVALDLIEEAKRKSRQTKSFTVNERYVSLKTKDIIILIMSATSGTSVKLNDLETGELIEISPQDAKSAITTYLNDVSRQNYKYGRALSKIKSSDDVNDIRRSLMTVGLRM